MVHQEQEVGLQDGAMLDQGMYTKQKQNGAMLDQGMYTKQKLFFISIFRFLEENNVYKLRLRHDKKIKRTQRLLNM